MSIERSVHELEQQAAVWAVEGDGEELVQVRVLYTAEELDLGLDLDVVLAWVTRVAEGISRCVGAE